MKRLNAGKNWRMRLAIGVAAGVMAGLSAAGGATSSNDQAAAEVGTAAASLKEALLSLDANLKPGTEPREFVGILTSEPVEIVDVFRRSEFVPEVVDDAIAKGARILWCQLGVIHLAAARRAQKAGMTVVMDRCPAIEYRRLF